MGLKNFFQSAKQDAIDRIVDERADRLANERAGRLVANARANIRNEVLQEFRGMSAEEIAAMLERELPPASGNGASPD